MVNIEIGQNTKELIEKAAAYLAEPLTFSWWDTAFGTTIGSALVSDYMLRGGKSPAIILGLTYAGLLLHKSRLGFMSVALLGTLLYWKMLCSDAKNKK